MEIYDIAGCVCSIITSLATKLLPGDYTTVLLTSDTQQHSDSNKGQQSYDSFHAYRLSLNRTLGEKIRNV